MRNLKPTQFLAYFFSPSTLPINIFISLTENLTAMPCNIRSYISTYTNMNLFDAEFIGHLQQSQGPTSKARALLAKPRSKQQSQGPASKARVKLAKPGTSQQSQGRSSKVRAQLTKPGSNQQSQGQNSKARGQLANKNTKHTFTSSLGYKNECSFKIGDLNKISAIYSILILKPNIIQLLIKILLGLI